MRKIKQEDEKKERKNYWSDLKDSKHGTEYVNGGGQVYL